MFGWKTITAAMACGAAAAVAWTAIKGWWDCCPHPELGL